MAKRQALAATETGITLGQAFKIAADLFKVYQKFRASAGGTSDTITAAKEAIAVLVANDVTLADLAMLIDLAVPLLPYLMSKK